MNYIGNGMRPGVSLGVLGYPGVSWGNQTDPCLSVNYDNCRHGAVRIDIVDLVI